MEQSFRIECRSAIMGQKDKVNKIGRTDWADCSRSGDLPFAMDGRLYRVPCKGEFLAKLEDAVKVADLSRLCFEGRESPQEARRCPRIVGSRPLRVDLPSGLHKSRITFSCAPLLVAYFSRSEASCSRQVLGNFTTDMPNLTWNVTWHGQGSRLRWSTVRTILLAAFW